MRKPVAINPKCKSVKPRSLLANIISRRAKSRLARELFDLARGKTCAPANVFNTSQLAFIQFWDTHRATSLSSLARLRLYCRFWNFAHARARNAAAASFVFARARGWVEERIGAFATFRFRLKCASSNGLAGYFVPVYVPMESGPEYFGMEDEDCAR